MDEWSNLSYCLCPSVPPLLLSFWDKFPGKYLREIMGEKKRVSGSGREEQVEQYGGRKMQSAITPC
uniref:Uncharacterized protein n=1 Tax=Setaria digitata TaxID=48799 RepID=A0A915PKZ3_9BILA